MKQIKILVLTTLFLSIFAIPAIASPDISVAVNGKLVSFPDQKPYIDSANRTMVPVRFPAESLGATVDWLQDTRQVHVTNKAHDALKDADIMATIGRKDVVVNGETKYMDTVAVITNSRTMVPVRFISEYLGATVTWNSGNNVAHVFSKGQSEAEQKAIMEHIAQEVKGQQPVATPGQPKYIGMTTLPDNIVKGYQVKTYEAALPLTIADGTTIKSITKGTFDGDIAIVARSDNRIGLMAPNIYFGNKCISGVLNADTNSNWWAVGNGFEAYYYLADNISNRPYLDVDVSQPDKIAVSGDGNLYWIPNPLK